MPSGTFWGYKIVGLIHTFMHAHHFRYLSTSPGGHMYSSAPSKKLQLSPVHPTCTRLPLPHQSTNTVKKGELGAQIHCLFRLMDACYCLKTLHYSHKEFKSLTVRQRVDTFIHWIRHDPAHKTHGKLLT